MKKILKTGAVHAVCLIVLLSFSIALASDIATTKPVRVLSQNDITLLPGSDATSALYNERKDIYAKGFNDALECVALVNLEFDMNGKEKTFKEIYQICRERNDVSER